MRRVYKNQLFEFLTKSSIGVDMFTFDEAISPDERSVLTIKNTPFSFFIHENDFDMEMFSVTYTLYNPQFSVTKYSERFQTFDGVLTDIKYWLDNPVSKYWEDKNTPDLWSEYLKYGKAIDLTNFGDFETSEFNIEESKKFKLAISQMKGLIQLEYNTTPEQQYEIDKKLDYLIEAVDRLNKFDWGGTLFSVFMSILINLSVDSSQGARLFEMLKNLLKNIPSISN